MDVEAELRDPGRLAALRAARLVDTPPELAFDQLTRLAAKLLQAPAAFVSLVDDYRQFFKSRSGSVTGLEETVRETPLSQSFCKFAVASKQPLLVEDARTHPDLQNTPAASTGVVAYAGIPLFSPEGQALGALCVVDSRPRVWRDEEIEHLRSLAASVTSLIEMRRRALAGAADDEAEQVERQRRVQQLRAAALAHLDRLDAYRRLVEQAAENEGFLEQEAAVREALLASEGALRDHEELLATAFRADPPPEPATALLDAVTAYLRAEDARATAIAKFSRLEIPLSDLEQVANAVQHAEQALRLEVRRSDGG